MFTSMARCPQVLWAKCVEEIFLTFSNRIVITQIGASVIRRPPAGGLTFWPFHRTQKGDDTQENWPSNNTYFYGTF